jgi:hypothetical protein
MLANLSRKFNNCLIKEKVRYLRGREEAKLFVHADASDIFMMLGDN